ncbi:ABC transporter ATP-binding protein [Clostridium sp. CMCC3677]|uniref:ABC transporter ATP-binding protein n=1 Tax=Clostridium sp. CMCC3677 TaxID=2949963 RepID=UPI0013F0545C|nr:ABC transporter ATP-binding protein [Clostridium sp. CMCC3677]NFG61381.1 ABC transporter ATP-binding protein [Clostridium botulinum]NFQ09148.1 ABC transporter ATP-binding protein [Clostridium botulinum]
MFTTLKQIIKLSGNMSSNIKKSFIYSFIDGIFESFPLIAIFYFFKGINLDNSIEPMVEINVIIKCTVILLVGIIGRIICKFTTYRLQGHTGYQMIAKERLDMGEKLKRVPMGFFNQNNLGELTNTVTSDMQFVEKQAPFILDKMVNSIINVFVTCIAMIIFDWKIGFVFLTGLFLAILILNLMQKKALELTKTQKEAQVKVVSSVLEYIQGISIFKLFNLSNNSNSRIKSSFDEYSRANCNLELKFIPLNTLFSLSLKIACGIILFLSPYLVLNGKLSIIKMIVILVAIFSIYTPVEALGSITGLTRMLEISLNKIENIKKFPLIDENTKDINLSSFNIDFKNVSFGYNDNETVINNVSFHIPEKSMTAIVGHSGCGKTTITRLIARFWDVEKGSIKIGRVNIKNMTCDSILKHITIVFQNVYLFNDTIANNIRLGKYNASMQEIEEAAKKARCYEFIKNLPDGFDTIIGEGGSSLSGGEKQRISIARAILKDASIVLLDEATSSIDPENEFYIQQAISELVRNKTLIVIAHRLSTIKEANQILVMENGQIVQKGIHDELIKEKGVYKKFWEVREKAGNWKLN